MKNVQQTFLAILLIVILVISTSCSQPPAPAISPTDIAATVEAAVAATVAAISAENEPATSAAVIVSPVVQATTEPTGEPTGEFVGTEEPSGTSAAQVTGEPTEVGIGPIIMGTTVALTPITATAVVTSTTAPTATVIVTATLLPTSTEELTGTVVPAETTILTTTVVPTATVIPTTTVMPTTTAITTATVEPTVTTIPTGTVEPTPSPVPTATPTPPTPPTSTPTVGPSPTPTAMPATVFLGSHHSYRSGSAFVVVGEAINGGNTSVFGVTIIATFYDASGNLVGATESAAFLPQTLPTQANPFKLQLVNAPANVDRYELTLRWDEITINTFDRATIVSEELSTANGIEITGEIRNDHRSDLRNLVVVATFYDENRAVIDVVSGRTSVESLPPGATATFSVQATNASVPYATYLVQIEGMLWQ